MGATAALIATQVALTANADSKAKNRMKAEEAKAAAEKQRIADSTPFGSSKSKNNAATERELLRRRLNSGRSSTILQKSDTVG